MLSLAPAAQEVLTSALEAAEYIKQAEKRLLIGAISQDLAGLLRFYD